ncbi:MAG: DUF2080 family transposase-associated protein [Methanosarcinaceae archaeon]
MKVDCFLCYDKIACSTLSFAYRLSNGYQVIEKTVKSSGNSGRVYVPKDWIGKKVKIFLLEQ